MADFESILRASAGPIFESGITQGDCIEVMEEVPADHKFDVIIADPPKFNAPKIEVILKDPPYGSGTGKRKRRGKDKEAVPLDKYIEWTEQWLMRCRFLLADDGIIYVYGQPQILARVAAQYPVDEQHWLTLPHTNRKGAGSTLIQPSHENILCLCKPAHKVPASVLEKLSREVELKEPDVVRGGAPDKWFMCRDCGNEIFRASKKSEHRDHDIMMPPAQKPVALTRRLIKSRIKGSEGRVLIPFAGCGLECFIAEEIGVEWMGIELNPEYMVFAQKWMNQVLNV